MWTIVIHGVIHGVIHDEDRPKLCEFKQGFTLQKMGLWCEWIIDKMSGWSRYIYVYVCIYIYL